MIPVMVITSILLKNRKNLAVLMFSGSMDFEEQKCAQQVSSDLSLHTSLV